MEDIKKELMGRDGPQQEEEFNEIADLPKLKPADMPRFENLLVCRGCAEEARGDQQGVYHGWIP